ncbi:MAG: LptE family protein [Acidobacteria bacterium]|nr:LptE family protein [Acidobacteriota bacterium]
MKAVALSFATALRILPIAVACLGLAGAGCGYRFAARNLPGVPSAIRVIAIPAFQNETFQYKIEQTLTAAVLREFLTRTSYRIQSQTEGSDAVLNGVVTAIYSSPIVFDPNSGRTAKVLMTVTLRVNLLDARTGQPLLEANDLIFREPYEVSADPRVYFEESRPALERLSHQVAAGVVSALLEGF